MKSKLFPFILLAIIIFISCHKNEKNSNLRVGFFHQSTGAIIWNGRSPSLITKAAKKINHKLATFVSPKARLPLMFKNFNKEHGTNYLIKEIEFPKKGWNNLPYDYYKLWVKNAGDKMSTLEILTKEYQVIIFKHCFPVSNIQPDQDTSDINSYIRTVSNYKLQYLALRDKLNEFPNTKFILFTGAAQVKLCTNEGEATRTKDFFEWVVKEWDIPNDNIYLWDFYTLETEGSLYLKDVYAESQNDSHPNTEFARRVTSLLFNRIIDVIENGGSTTTLIGEKIN